MDPRNRLWHDIVFVHCDVSALLSLRAVCRAFRALLRDSRLWLPLTMEVSRMRYSERVLGWAGVERAMKREEVTRANCDAGRYTRGPVLDVRGGGVRDVICVGGRVAVFCDVTVQLCDADTGARVVSIDVYADFDERSRVVMDRWIPFPACDGRVLLLDCVAARLAEVAPAYPERWYAMFNVAGSCVSYRTQQSMNVTVVHVSGGPDGVTIVREVACVQLASDDDHFALCERGRSYLLCGNDTLQLFDVATGQLKRTFTPRACSVDFAICDELTDVDHRSWDVTLCALVVLQRVRLCFGSMPRGCGPGCRCQCRVSRQR